MTRAKRAAGIRVVLAMMITAVWAITASAFPAPDPPTYLLKWGSSGSGPGQFSNPVGVATDELGNVYVVDQSNQRVQKFDRLGSFLAQWGGFGSGNGQFANPSGIAVDLSGNVFVVDGGNFRIQKFTSTGTYVTQWGSSGSGAGQFTGLSGNCATDAAGNVYVADAHRVQKFTNAGAFVTQWGSLGSADGQFNAPNSVATDAASNVYVVDRLNSRVQKFTSTGTFVLKFSLPGNTKDVAVDAVGDVYICDDDCHIRRYSSTGVFEIQWGTPGSGNGQLDSPRSIDVDAEGNVYVAETFNQRIQKFSGWGATVVESAPAFLHLWGGLGTGNGQFYAPYGVAIDAAGNVYVTDFTQNRVQKFSSSGAYLSQWGQTGTGPGSFTNPFGIAVDLSGNVYVADYTNRRIQKFTSTGGYLTEWGTDGTGSGQFSGVVGVATDAAGNVYATDVANQRVQKFSSTGTYLTQWGTIGSGNGQFLFPCGIAIDASDNVYVVDRDNSRIQKFTSTGTYLTQWGTPGSGNGQFNVAIGVATDANGNVYVADTENHRIQKFTSAGAYLTQWGTNGGGNGQFSEPYGVAIAAAGSVYVADAGNSRMQSFLTRPAIALVSDVRNDQGRQARLRVLRTSADAAGWGGVITGYAVYRRIDPPPAAAAAASARRLASPEAAALEGWDYVTTFPARGDAVYSVVVPTLADANGDSRAYTAFMVSALTSNPLTYYDSALEAGYSIDNLSPPAPTPFMAAYTAGATHLHWGVSPASDFGTFRLYRGATAGFVPGPGNLVTATTDTGYVDAGPAGSYYKLAAVDLNGNESPYALVGPAQTTEVPGDGEALSFGLEEIRPNPVRARDLVLRFTLATGEKAKLELIDLAGRRIADHTATGAGSHVVDMGRERLRAGIYFVQLSQGPNARVRRAVVLD